MEVIRLEAKFSALTKIETSEGQALDQDVDILCCFKANTCVVPYRLQHNIVIVNSKFLQRPQKRSRRNQFIHRRSSKSKLIGSGSDPESQAGRQSDGYGGWCLELRPGGR